MTNITVLVDQLIASGRLEEARGVIQQSGEACVGQPAQPVLDRWFLVNPGWHEILSDHRIRLRPPNELDLPFFDQCFNDKNFMRQFHRMANHSREPHQILSVLRKTPLSVVRNRNAHWIIELVKPISTTARDNKFHQIGIISLANIMIAHRRAEFIIGIRGSIPIGSALRASLLLIDHGFRSLELQKITSIVLADNPHSQRSTLSLGFEQEGFRKAHLKDPITGEFLDCYENGLLKNVFLNNSRLNQLRRRLSKHSSHSTSQVGALYGRV